MKSYKSIADIKYSDTENFNMKRFDMEDDVRDILLLLEKVNPCRQRYITPIESKRDHIGIDS